MNACSYNYVHLVDYGGGGGGGRDFGGKGGLTNFFMEEGSKRPF